MPPFRLREVPCDHNFVERSKRSEFSAFDSGLKPRSTDGRLARILTGTYSPLAGPGRLVVGVAMLESL